MQQNSRKIYDGLKEKRNDNYTASSTSYFWKSFSIFCLVIFINGQFKFEDFLFLPPSCIKCLCLNMKHLLSVCMCVWDSEVPKNMLSCTCSLYNMHTYALIYLSI